jgi:hypothetical protein
MNRRKPIPHEKAEQFCRKIDGILDAIDEIETDDFGSKCSKGWAWATLHGVKMSMVKETHAESGY